MGKHPKYWGQGVMEKVNDDNKKFFDELDLHRPALGQCSGRLGPPTANRQAGYQGLRASRRAVSNVGPPRKGASPAHVDQSDTRGLRRHSKR